MDLCYFVAFAYTNFEFYPNICVVAFIQRRKRGGGKCDTENRLLVRPVLFLFHSRRDCSLLLYSKLNAAISLGSITRVYTRSPLIIRDFLERHIHTHVHTTYTIIFIFSSFSTASHCRFLFSIVAWRTSSKESSMPVHLSTKAKISIL